MADKKQGQLNLVGQRVARGAKETFAQEKYQEYLDLMARLQHQRYSVNNVILISMKNSNASFMAGFEEWKELYGRQVKAGERGITILAPAPKTVIDQVAKLDPETKEPVLDEEGKQIFEDKEVTKTDFEAVTVFDISQTKGTEVPKLEEVLKGTAKNFDLFMEVLETISPVQIEVGELPDGENGVYNRREKRIVLQAGIDEVEMMKAAIHEMAYAMLHDTYLNTWENKQPVEKQKDRETKTFEAESVAYVIGKYYGLDMSDYNFKELTKWGEDKPVAEIKKSLKMIRNTATKWTKEIDEKVRETYWERAESMLDVYRSDEIKGEQSISFYVAECGEFHSLGEFHENLTLQEAIEIYNSIPSERINGIKEIGCRVETGLEGIFSEASPKLFSGNTIDVDGVNSIGYIRGNKLVTEAMKDLLVAFPEANILNMEAMKNFDMDMQAALQELII